MVTTKTSILCLTVFASGVLLRCSNAEMSGGGGGRAASKDIKKSGNPQSVAKGDLGLTLIVNSGEKATYINATLKPTGAPGAQGAREFALDPASVKHSEIQDFPAERATQIAKSKLKAVITPDGNGSSIINVTLDTAGIADESGPIAPASLKLTQTASGSSWTKAEGPVAAFGTLKTNGAQPCVIEPSGDQPKTGVHAVILTKPAPCDFKMPTVTVGRTTSETAVVPIGTYWSYAWPGAPTTGWKIAHNFPLTQTAPKTKSGVAVGLDNGYILIQPDGISYLLVDAGVASPGNPAYKTAATIANDLSQSLKFGPTVLKQPVSGSAADGFASSTVFKKGSVIAIYDDSPDMGGIIDVKALISDVNAHLGLSWEAKLGL